MRYNRGIRRDVNTYFHNSMVGVLLGTPVVIAFLFSASGDLVTPENDYILNLPESRFIEMDSEVTVSLDIDTKDPVNVAAGVVTYPKEMVAIQSIDESTTIIDLWAEEPSFINELGILPFAGGITKIDGHTGAGSIFSLTFTATQEGTATISLKNPSLLAHDGTGQNIYGEHEPIVFHIREAGLPSPDLNGDNHITLMDLNYMYFNMLLSYSDRYDLNGDGEVNILDMRSIIALLGE